MSHIPVSQETLVSEERGSMMKYEIADAPVGELIAMLARCFMMALTIWIRSASLIVCRWRLVVRVWFPQAVDAHSRPRGISVSTLRTLPSRLWPSITVENVRDHITGVHGSLGVPWTLTAEAGRTGRGCPCFTITAKPREAGIFAIG